MLHQPKRIRARACRRAEAGHREAVNLAPVDSQHVTGGDGDQNRERGVEAPRDADV